jgi:hypothetical protein
MSDRATNISETELDELIDELADLLFVKWLEHINEHNGNV